MAQAFRACHSIVQGNHSFSLDVQSVQSVQGSYRSRAAERTGYRDALYGLNALNMACSRESALNSGLYALNTEVPRCEA